MKRTVVILLALFGLYWLFVHTAPLPLNHEQFGLYDHSIHSLVGIMFLVGSGLAVWLWKEKAK